MMEKDHAEKVEVVNWMLLWVVWISGFQQIAGLSKYSKIFTI